MVEKDGKKNGQQESRREIIGSIKIDTESLGIWTSEVLQSVTKERKSAKRLESLISLKTRTL